MKRLFQVGNFYFDVKENAKTYRDEGGGTHVSLGPDHWRYGLKGGQKTHSHQNKGYNKNGRPMGGHTGDGFKVYRRKGVQK